MQSTKQNFIRIIIKTKQECPIQKSLTNYNSTKAFYLRNTKHLCKWVKQSQVIRWNRVSNKSNWHCLKSPYDKQKLSQQQVHHSSKSCQILSYLMLLKYNLNKKWKKEFVYWRKNWGMNMKSKLWKRLNKYWKKWQILEINLNSFPRKIKRSLLDTKDHNPCCLTSLEMNINFKWKRHKKAAFDILLLVIQDQAHLNVRLDNLPSTAIRYTYLLIDGRVSSIRSHHHLFDTNLLRHLLSRKRSKLVMFIRWKILYRRA